jgi:hypothetical protein
MIIEVKELEALQSNIQEEIKSLSKNDTIDNSRLFDLKILDSNLSLLLMGADKEKNIELGPFDKQIKKEILDFRLNNKSKPAAEIYIEEVSLNCEEISTSLKALIEKVENYDEEILAKNFMTRLKKALLYTEELSELKYKTKKEKMEWQNQTIPLSIKGAAATLGSAKTAKKAQAARENGKKGGRPRKNKTEA